MKKLFILSVAFTFFASLSVFPQTWTSIATLNVMGFGVYDLKAFDNNLYIGGGFTMANGDTSYYSCKWDGSTLTPQTAFINGSGIMHFEVFNDSLYATGGLDFGVAGMGLGTWDGSTWQNAGNFTLSQDAIYADGIDLYVGSYDGLVHKKTGNGSFAPLSSAFEGPNHLVYAIAKYNGSIIAAGNIDSYNGAMLHNIARWDGTAWQSMGTGLNSEVRCLEVFNGELYAGGVFGSAGGVPVRNIAKWNGTSWSDVGDGVTSNPGYGIWDMKVNGNNLYVVGDFTQLGSVDARYLAIWNGINWQDDGFDVAIPFFLNSVEVYNNNVYVGSFAFYGDPSNVYRGPLTTGISAEEEYNVRLSLFPNPSTGMLNVHFNSIMRDDYELEIYSAAGTLILGHLIRNDQLIDLSSLSQGTYTLLLRNKNDILQSREFILQ